MNNNQMSNHPLTFFVERNNWSLEDFRDVPGNIRVNFCDRLCTCTTVNSRIGLGSTRSRMVSQINQEFIDELNVFNCWITEMYEVIELTPTTQTYRDVDIRDLVTRTRLLSQ